MTAAAPRMANQTTVDRRLGVAMAAVIAVLALAVAVAIGQPVATSTTTSATSPHDFAVGPVRYGNLHAGHASANAGLDGRDLFNAAELANPPAAAPGTESAGGINVSGVPYWVTNDLSVGTPKQVPTR